MKKLLILLTVLSCGVLQIEAAHFKSGEELIIDEANYGDHYIAGGEVSVNAVIYGDLVIAGGEVSVNDSVIQDALVSGGKIWINGYIGDDVRVAGGEIEINGTVRGDVISFGGKILIGENAEIWGDVIAFGGEIEIEGEVTGDLLCMGGEVELSGEVDGDVELKAGKVELEGYIGGSLKLSTRELNLDKNARCDGVITYWTGDSDDDLSSLGNAKYDESLAMENRDINWKVLGTILGVGFVAYWLIFIVSAFLLLLFLQQFFGKYFIESATSIRDSFVKSFGYGMLFFIGVPMASLILIFTIVGLPIGLLIMGFFMLSLMFSTAISGLVVSHYFEQRSGQNWSYFQNIGYALLTVIILKIIFLIPLLGNLAKIIVLAAVYGSFLMLIVERQRSRKSIGN